LKEEDKDKLFVPFESIKYGRKLNPSGTGLGLSICKSILNEINCSIQLLESETVGPNKGSTFSFDMPWEKPRFKKVKRQTLIKGQIPTVI
jgi:signal transduction histidine kinase